MKAHKFCTYVLSLVPCSLLFVHRVAGKEDWNKKLGQDEIKDADMNRACCFEEHDTLENELGKCDVHKSFVKGSRFPSTLMPLKSRSTSFVKTELVFDANGKGTPHVTERDTVAVAVIGAGPGGLSFCHAMESSLKTKTNQDFSVTCFERSSQPGGVWQASNENNPTGMYDNLWTNGPSHSLEYFDYTFDEHFGKPVTVYLKRQDLLEYVLGRVTKHCPDFFEKYVRFETEVVRVVYDESKQMFDIDVKDLRSGKITTHEFHKCVWACGDNAKPKIPQDLISMFRNDGFKGRLIHSSDTAQFEEDVRGKRVLLIGGGFSAEDLALQAIKCAGVDKIYCATRDSEGGHIAQNESWPMDKVEILKGRSPIGVTEDGRCIEFEYLKENLWSGDYAEYEKKDGKTVIRNIDTIIFCTGYDINFGMLDEPLRQGHPEGYGSPELKIHKDWRMQPNKLTKLLGHVKPGKTEYIQYNVHPALYRGVLISNPNMMFLTQHGSDFPLLAIDMYAHLLAGFITGTTKLPTQDEMKQHNDEQVLSEMNLPQLRCYMDINYTGALEKLFALGHISEDVYRGFYYESYLNGLRMLARVAREANYPLDIGTYEKSNEKRRAMIRMDIQSGYHRTQIESSEEEKAWKTFRDYSNGEDFQSFFTGRAAVSLEKPWLEM